MEAATSPTATQAIEALKAAIATLEDTVNSEDPDQEEGDAYYDLAKTLRGTSFTENVLGALDGDAEQTEAIAWEEFITITTEVHTQEDHIG